MKIESEKGIIELPDFEQEYESYLHKAGVSKNDALSDDQVKEILQLAVKDFFGGSINPDALSAIALNLWSSSDKFSGKYANDLPRISDIAFNLRTTGALGIDLKKYL